MSRHTTEDESDVLSKGLSLSQDSMQGEGFLEDMLDESLRGSQGDESVDIDEIMAKQIDIVDISKLGLRKVTPSLILSPVKQEEDNNQQKTEEEFAPGVRVFNFNFGFRKFTFEELTLDTFKYDVKKSLKRAGRLSNFDTTKLNQDVFYLIDILSPMNPSSVLIYKEADYKKVCDYMFYKISTFDPHKEHQNQYITKAFLDLLNTFHYEWNFNLSKFISVLSNYRANMKLLLPDISDDMSPEDKQNNKIFDKNNLISDGFVVPSPKVLRHPVSPSELSTASSAPKSLIFSPKIPRVDRFIDGVKPLSKAVDDCNSIYDANQICKSSSGPESSRHKKNLSATFSGFDSEGANNTDDGSIVKTKDVQEAKAQDTNSGIDEWSDDGTESQETEHTILPKVEALHALKTEESVSLSECLGRLYIPNLDTKMTFKDGTQEQFPIPPATLVNLLNLIRTLIDQGKFELVEKDSFDELHTFIYVLTVIAQDRNFIDDRCLQIMIQDIICLLFENYPLFGTSQEGRKLALNIIMVFSPGNLDLSCVSWDYSLLPKSMSAGGMNHPLNLVYTLNLVPNTTECLANLRQTMAFICLQLILDLEQIEVPDKLSPPAVWNLLAKNLERWYALKETPTNAKACILFIEMSICSNSKAVRRQDSAVDYAYRLILQLFDHYEKNLPDEKDEVDLCIRKGILPSALRQFVSLAKTRLDAHIGEKSRFIE